MVTTFICLSANLDCSALEPFLVIVHAVLLERSVGIFDGIFNFFPQQLAFLSPSLCMSSEDDFHIPTNQTPLKNIAVADLRQLATGFKGIVDAGLRT